MLHYVTKNDIIYILLNRISLNAFVPDFLSFMVRFAKIFGAYASLSFFIHILHSAI